MNSPEKQQQLREAFRTVGGIMSLSTDRKPTAEDEKIFELIIRGELTCEEAVQMKIAEIKRAHITSAGDMITAYRGNGETLTGTLDEVVADLRSRGVCEDELTMPHKDAANSPTTGQRIAIHAAMKNTVWIGEHGLIDRNDFASARALAPLISSEQLAHWKAEGEIFAIDHGGIDLYPRYAFDSVDPCAPRAVMRRIIATLDMPPWNAAWWFCSGCSMLDSRRPQDVLGVDPEAVLAAAVDQARGITHG